jgi:DNA-directed RNA polymerase subunit E'/Rpb7
MATNNQPAIFGVYLKSQLTTKLYLHITEVGRRVKQNLETLLKQKIANKCIEEGFVSPNGIEIIQYSSGVVSLDRVCFDVVYSCWIAHPVDGMLIECKVKTITKAGIHAQVIDKDGNIPITVFIARDHNNQDPRFHQVSEGQIIYAEVIGSKYELNEPFISVIANLKHPPGQFQALQQQQKQPKETKSPEGAMDILYK